MITVVQLLPYTNTLIFLFAIPAFYINLKIYLNLKLKDNLLAAIYFIADAVAAFSVAISLNFYQPIIVLTGFCTMIASISLFLIAVRILWTNPPVYIYPFILIYTIGFINLIFSEDLLDFGNVGDTTTFFGITELTFLIVIIAVSVSKTPVTITRVKTTKILWIMYPTIKLIAHGFYLLRTEILQLPPTIFPWFYLVVLPQVIASFLLMTLHVLYPEAMLISEEQIYRAKNLYNKLDQFEINDSSRDIGVLGVLAYLKSIPIEVMTPEINAKD